MHHDPLLSDSMIMLILSSYSLKFQICKFFIEPQNVFLVSLILHVCYLVFNFTQDVCTVVPKPEWLLIHYILTIRFKRKNLYA